MKLRGVKKRCSHGRKQWNDCACPWYYSVMIKGVHHRRKLGVFEHRLAAESALATIKVRLANGLPATEAQDAEPVTAETLKSYSERWVSRMTNLKPSTIYFYQDNLNNHILPVLGSNLITVITRSHCHAFTLKLREKKLATSTREGILTTLSALFGAAVDDPDCPVSANPAGRLRKLLKDPSKLKRTGQKLTRDKYFDRDEVPVLLATAREHFPEWYPFVLCGLRTGLRLSELLALQWGDIDWRKSYIHVQRGFVRGQLGTPKSGRDRTVDLSRQTRTTLYLWRRQLRVLALKRGRSSELVFPSTAGTPFDDSNARKFFTAIVKKAELRHRTPHAMRHTFISMLLQNGESLAYVSKQAGHQSTDITFNVYGHFMPGGNRAAVDRLDDERKSA